MIPTSAEMDAPLSPGDLVTMADVVQLELTGDTSYLLSWLGLLSPVQKQQLWGVLPEPARQVLAGLKQPEAA